MKARGKGSTRSLAIQKSGHSTYKHGQPKGGTVKSAPSGKKPRVPGGHAPKRGVKGRR